MKNVIAATVAAATLFAGSAAFADGGYVDHQGFISAHKSMQQASATKAEVELNDRTGKTLVTVTLVPTDSTLAGSVNKGS